MKPGTVITAKETATVDGFVLDGTPKSIEIKEGETQTLTFYNVPIGGLELIKVSEADKSQRIEGVTFEIRKMDGALVDTVTTGDRGRVHVSLDAGDYYCVEVEAAEGFKLDSTPHYFTIKDNEITTLTVTNAPFSGIILHKIDSVTGLGIYNVKFLVYDQNKNPIGEYTTDDGGYIYIDDLTVQGKGRLYIRELEAAPGYELDKEYKTVYVQPGKTIEIEWQNTPITGQFQIHKFAAEYNEVTGTPAGAPLQGAVYEISEARSGKVVDYITTDARGVVASKPLPLGRYKIVEVTAPAYWQVSGKTFVVLRREQLLIDHAPHSVQFQDLADSLLRVCSAAAVIPALSALEIRLYSTLALLHDVGKRAIPQEILNKPGSLTKEEFEVMKIHTTQGCDLPELRECEVFSAICDVCRHHHERWDGSGYPDRLAGDSITPWVQVVGLADAFDALVHPRV